MCAVKHTAYRQEKHMTETSTATTTWVYHDGGRADAGYRGTTGDCTTRAIAIAAGLSYQEVYDLVNAYGKRERPRKGRKTRASARNGIPKRTIDKLMKELGWTWTPTMHIGSGCQVHLRPDELPPGRLVVRVSKHMVAVIDGVAYDNHDPTRDGDRCVYGYYVKAASEEAAA
jgi:hypothetical protein